MNFNRNEKINQVSENTLVIGMDIAKHKHYACAIDDRGRALLFRVMMPLILHNPAFKQLHEYYTTRTVNPL